MNMNNHTKTHNNPFIQQTIGMSSEHIEWQCMENVQFHLKTHTISKIFSVDDVDDILFSLSRVMLG